MITATDWSDLITVNYTPGMGGDFFSMLLDSNLREDAPSFQCDENFRYEFNDDAFNCKFKNFNFYFDELQTKANPNSKHSVELHDLHSKIYVENNLDQTIENLRNTIVEKYGSNFKTKRVLSTHFSLKNITLQQLFPKSKNIFLFTKNQNFDVITKFLFFYKVCVPRIKMVDGNYVVPFTTVQDTYVDAEHMVYTLMQHTVNVSDKEKLIDMYDLIMGKKNYNSQLSTLCGSKIVLNKSAINQYKSQTAEILNAFGIDLNTQYEESTLHSLIVNAVDTILREKFNG